MDTKKQINADQSISLIEEYVRDKKALRTGFLDNHFNCQLCGSELIYSHVTHFVFEEVVVEAECSSCCTQKTAEVHKLQ